MLNLLVVAPAILILGVMACSLSVGLILMFIAIFGANK